MQIKLNLAYAIATPRSNAKMIQSEKMSALGQLVASVAPEINNPVNFIHGNLTHIQNYAQDLLEFIQLYQ
jgi:two-component system, NtrC family, sensor kinase